MASFGKCARGVLLVAVVVLWVGSASAVGVPVPNLQEREYVNEVEFDVLVTPTASALGEVPSTFVPEGKTVLTAVDSTVGLTSAAFVYTLSRRSAPEMGMRFSSAGSDLSRVGATAGVQVTIAGFCKDDAGDTGLLLLVRPMPLGVVAAPDALQQEHCAHRVAR